MSLTGEPDGLPQKVGVPVADLFAGLYGCIGILAALRHRDLTGHRASRSISACWIRMWPGWPIRA